MKAVRLNEWGKALAVEDIPQPQPNADEVLVCVRNASINPFDAALWAGYLQGIAQTPLTMGVDFAGDVVTVGSNITHLKAGDAVYGLTVLGAGAFAEYTIVNSQQVSKKPQSLDYPFAAGLPLPAMAAWKTLFDIVKIKKGERLLVHGVGGNVGGLVLQLAKLEDVFVYGTEIPEKAEHAKALGVDRLILPNERFEDVVEDVDAVIDLVGGEMLERSYNVLKPGGRYVTSLMENTPQEEPTRRGIQSFGLAAWPNAEILEKMTELVDAGKIRVFVNRVFPLDEVNNAMAYRMETKTPGKIILTVL